MVLVGGGGGGVDGGSDVVGGGVSDGDVGGGGEDTELAEVGFVEDDVLENTIRLLVVGDEAGDTGLVDGGALEELIALEDDDGSVVGELGGGLELVGEEETNGLLVDVARGTETDELVSNEELGTEDDVGDVLEVVALVDDKGVSTETEEDSL